MTHTCTDEFHSITAWSAPLPNAELPWSLTKEMLKEGPIGTVILSEETEKAIVNTGSFQKQTTPPPVFFQPSLAEAVYTYTNLDPENIERQAILTVYLTVQASSETGAYMLHRTKASKTRPATPELLSLLYATQSSKSLIGGRSLRQSEQLKEQRVKRPGQLMSRVIVAVPLISANARAPSNGYLV